MSLRAAVFVVLGFLLLPSASAIAQSAQTLSPEGMVSEAVEKQRARPLWFHPFTTLLPEIPYAYEASATLAVQREGDAELSITARTRQQLVLGEGWQEVRTTDIRTTSTGRDHNTLTGIRQILFQSYRQRLAALDRERLGEPREALRARNTQAWDSFLRAFKFERLEGRVRNGRAATIFSFTPRRGYQPDNAAGTAFYSKISGQIWIDDADLEIVRLDYEFTADSAEFMSFGPVRKKTRYSMDLAKSIDGAWLPVLAKTELFKRNGSAESHDVYTVEFSRYRKFDVDVKISVPDQQLSTGERR